MTLIATVGGASSNSYCTLATAELYVGAEAHPEPWTGDDDDAKEILLIYATRLLQREQWAGTKASITQALAWPRRWAPTLEYTAMPDVIAVEFVDQTMLYYDDLTIPPPIVQGTAELARLLQQQGASLLDFDSTRNIQSKATGPLSKTFLPPAERVRGLGYFPTVLALVAPLLRQGAGMLVDRV